MGRGRRSRPDVYGQNGLPAYGNTDSWHDDDMRVALVVLLIAMSWIWLTVKRRQAGGTGGGWLDGIGFGFRGHIGAPSFPRRACIKYTDNSSIIVVHLLPRSAMWRCLVILNLVELTGT